MQKPLCLVCSQFSAAQGHSASAMVSMETFPEPFQHQVSLWHGQLNKIHFKNLDGAVMVIRCSGFPLTEDGSRDTEPLAGFIFCTSIGAAPSPWKRLPSGMERGRTREKTKQGSQGLTPDVPYRVLLLLAVSPAFHPGTHDVCTGVTCLQVAASQRQNRRSILEKEKGVMWNRCFFPLIAYCRGSPVTNPPAVFPLG